MFVPVSFAFNKKSGTSGIAVRGLHYQVISQFGCFGHFLQFFVTVGLAECIGCTVDSRIVGEFGEFDL